MIKPDQQLYRDRSQVQSRTSHFCVVVNDGPDLEMFYSYLVQSRPIQMRAAFLYLSNRWMNFKMLLKPNLFLYLEIFSKLAFPSIPQFIGQF